MNGPIDFEKPYIKGGKDAGGHAKYIATRERVELVPDGRLATQKQAQLIDSLTKDFPGAKKLPEYGSYRDTPTKVNASVFITRTLQADQRYLPSGDDPRLRAESPIQRLAGG